jgi:Zn-dependent protease
MISLGLSYIRLFSYFFLILRHTFNLILTQQDFLTLWMDVATAHVFKRANYVAMSNYKHISILNNFSKLFEFIIQDHVLH